ncbi:MAG: DUF262 domain-containing protein [Gammaproteobacteria bacterium]|nr:DUF262 domain-containing protein [Gammaproteobacteria bacterium]
MHAHPIKFLELLNAQVQYVVPRWQRRYCWGQSDIERLVEDLVTISSAESSATHYGGTLLTFPEPGAAGVVRTIRVVDGQQRLTTVSILLACIAAELGPNGKCNDWTRQIIIDDRLTNPGKAPDKLRKLRLQDEDEEEYRRGLAGEPAGAGAVSQAWRIARRLVAKNDIESLLNGLDRLQVVSIGLNEKEDPQQIFESLNATGRPLTESEKVKNWLLMGLPDAEQQDLHDNHWLRIERSLDARHSTERVDMFLRDVLRWWTGNTLGIDRVYEEYRRYAVKSGQDQDRPALCRDLARLAGLYGKITGTSGPHGDRKIDRELKHLREIGIDVHRPLTLRLLHEADKADSMETVKPELAKTLAGIGTWTTRMWLADRTTAGMNKAVAEIAHEPGLQENTKFSEYWIKRIQRLRNTRVGVPSDGEVAEGIRSRKAYGGSATRSAFAILCELMEAEHREQSPARDHLTIEHVMPQKLTDEWKRDLGDNPEDKHGRYRDRLANLTLSGDATNSGLGTKTFAAKRNVYNNSSIGLTRSLAEEIEWNEAALERRAEDLTRRALKRWPWPEEPKGLLEATQDSAQLRWRIEEGPWHAENIASQMVLNVAAALLGRDTENARRLSGQAISSNIHPARRYPPGTTAGTLTMRAVPGHEEYVLYPYERDYATSAERCRSMGKRCNVSIEVEFEDTNPTGKFWKFLKEYTGGVPGQKDSWRGASQWSSHNDASDDYVGIYVGNSELLWLYIKSGESQASEARAERMRRCSWMIRERMSDQKLEGNIESNSANGWTIAVQRSWVRDDENGWPEAAIWIKEQCERLHAIAADQQD